MTAAGASGSDCISSFYEEKNRYLFPMLAFLQEEGVNIGVRIQELHFNINLTVQTHAHQLPPHSYCNNNATFLLTKTEIQKINADGKAL